MFGPTPVSTTKGATSGSYWIALALTVAALVYAAPHIWWMFGKSFGFPGTGGDFDTAFERTWFAFYNVITTGLVLAGAGIAVAVEYRWLRGGLQRLGWLLVLVGAILLLLRGGLGMATTILAVSGVTLFQGSTEAGVGSAALMWECWFLLAGVLFGLVVMRRRHSSSA